VHEVSNTFGESHFYVLKPRAGANGAITQACEKNFFVSPFLEMNLAYEFQIVPPGENTSVAMIVKRGADVALTASFAGERLALTDANIMRVWAGNPLMTLMVVAGIHWEALRIWLKGIRYLGRGRTAGLQAARNKTAA
jgi:uncharacterized protein